MIIGLNRLLLSTLSLSTTSRTGFRRFTTSTRPPHLPRISPLRPDTKPGHSYRDDLQPLPFPHPLGISRILGPPITSSHSQFTRIN